jgi:hypothetical protein
MYHTIKIKLVMLLIGAFTLAACGGDGSGAAPGPTPLATGTFTKTVVADGSNSFWESLFSTNTAMRFQFLYRAPDVNGSGNVQSISFRYEFDEPVSVSCPNVTIKMGHTNFSDLTATYADNVETGKGSFLTVLNDAAINIPAGSAGGYFSINLDTPFNYNGVDNVVVELVRTSGCTEIIETDNAQASYTVVDFHTTQSAPAMGTADTFLVHTKFNFVGGDDPVLYNATNNSIAPFTTAGGTQHAQRLFLASDINGAGPITGIAMRTGDNPTDAQSYTVNIKLGYTTLSALTDTFANNLNSGSPVSVASNLTFNVPAGVPRGEYIWLPLSDTFNYNGTDNLILDIEVLSATGGTTWLRSAGLPDRHMYGTVGDATGTVSNGGYDTKFRFNGGTMDVGLTTATSLAIQVFDGSATGGIMQSLYHPADLGTGGRITHVDVRLVGDSITAVHNNYTLRIGHTSKTALDIVDTYASNMDENMTVYSGSFTIPAGLKAGDWVSIPLDSVFSYDPGKNLVIFFSTLGGAATGNNVYASAAIRYASSTVVSDLGSDTTPTVGPADGIVIMRLQIQK